MKSRDPRLGFEGKAALWRLLKNDKEFKAEEGLGLNLGLFWGRV